MSQWQKSSFSGGTDGASCIEIAPSAEDLLLRESDDPDRILPATHQGLAALIRHLTSPPRRDRRIGER
ncbi:DUF397 domain-containing protein [Streptomyces sp. NPDC002643]